MWWPKPVGDDSEVLDALLALLQRLDRAYNAY